MVAHAGAGGEPLAEPGAYLFDRCLMFFRWQIHGVILLQRSPEGTCVECCLASA
jgi:hypothetical protein